MGTNHYCADISPGYGLRALMDVSLLAKLDTQLVNEVIKAGAVLEC